MEAKSTMMRSIWRQYESLVLRDDILHRVFHNTSGQAMYYQSILPRSLRRSFLELIHSDVAGHLSRPLVDCLSPLNSPSPVVEVWWGYRGGSPTAIRPSDPALCWSCPLVTPYYCRLGDLLCLFCVYRFVCALLSMYICI